MVSAKENENYLLPWNVTNKHPIAIFVLICWNVIRSVQKIYQLGLVHEIFHPNGEGGGKEFGEGMREVVVASADGQVEFAEIRRAIKAHLHKAATATANILLLITNLNFIL